MIEPGLAPKADSQIAVLHTTAPYVFDKGEFSKVAVAVAVDQGRSVEKLALDGVSSDMCFLKGLTMSRAASFYTCVFHVCLK